MNNQSSSFELLHDSVQKWIWRQGWTSLKDIQENSIPVVLSRESDVIISAATAGGKTEAAFLPILSHVLSNPSEGFDVLYVSPLKALINDQYRRLLEKQLLVKEGIKEEELVSAGTVGAEAFAWTLDIDGFNRDGGVMTGVSKGNDPVIMLHHGKKEFNLEEIVAFAITMQVPKGEDVVIFYKTADADAWNKEYQKFITIK